MTHVSAVSPGELGTYGSGLNRPESVLAARRGVFAADRRGGVAVVHADKPATLLPCRPTDDFLANGIALLPDGAFLIANIAPSGGVWRLEAGGQTRPFLLEAEGQPLSTANYVSLDRVGRIWISVSTRQAPREGGFLRANADGYLVLADARGARIVADDLWFTNEIGIDPAGRFLYAIETLGRRVVRFAVSESGTLGRRETVVDFGAGSGVFPDGLAFDEEGGLWVTSVVSNRIIRLDPEGSMTVVVDDKLDAEVVSAERQYAADAFTRADIDGGKNGRLGNATSLAFGGADRRTVFLGSVFNECLLTFRSPVAGAEPVHWHF